MPKTVEKNKTIKLRISGKSISEISQKLKIRRATISKWCKEIVLTDKDKKHIQHSVEKQSQQKLDFYYKQKKEKKYKLISKLKDETLRDVGKISKRELYLMGTVLYWAEGFKSAAEHRLGFCNSDPKMIIFYLKWLKDCFGVKTNEITLRLTVNESYRDKVDEIEDFWSKTLKIPRSQFTKPFFQKTLWKKEYNNKDDYHGVLRVHVNKSVVLLWKTLAGIEALKNPIN